MPVITFGYGKSGLCACIGVVIVILLHRLDKNTSSLAIGGVCSCNCLFCHMPHISNGLLCFDCIYPAFYYKCLLFINIMCYHIDVRIATLWFKKTLWVFGVKWQVRGLSNFNYDKPCVIVCNHQSIIDVIGNVTFWFFITFWLTLYVESSLGQYQNSHLWH